MVEITNDVFDIAWRIKSIDERYRLFYNNKARRYEVYIGDTMESIIPYSTLDVRTITYLRRTRRENIDRLMREIDEHNAMLEKAKEYEVARRAEERIEEVFR